MWELLRRPPAVDAPVKLWIPWLELQARLWDAAASDVLLAVNAPWMVDYLRRTVKDLKARYQPDEKWPGASSW